MVLLSYLLISTSFVAQLVSQQLSKLTSYSISIGKIHYSVNNFYELVLDDVVISDKNQEQEITTIPKLIIGLDKDNIWQLHHFNSITVINGVINDTGNRKYDISANLLNLVDSTVNLSLNNEKDKFSFQQINGAIKPFALSKQGKYQFDLSSQQVLFNQTPIKSVLVQGFYQDGVTSITNLGGNINNGFFVSKLKILADNRLDIDQLKINNVHVQLNDDNDIEQLPTIFSKFTIHQFSMFDSTIQLPSITIEKGNIEATNIAYDKQWNLGQSSLVFDAEKMVWHNEVFSSVLLQLKSQNNIFTIEKAIASWSRGNFNFSGIWQDNQLKLDQLTFSDVDYQLPEKFETVILPDIFNQVVINKLTVLPSILIRTYPDYPFTLVNFQISGTDVTLVQDKKLGLYAGTLFFKAERGSINRIDIKYPDLAVNFDSQGQSLLSFSTLINGGMVESTALINPSKTEFLSLKFTAYNITSSLLNEWKLIKQPPKAINYSVDLHGDIVPFGFSGTFSADGNDYVITP
ncbi:hypothetical protein [Gilliamella sp. wkB178]|uniref:hypothetical protein n=1 Tax=Gilliamella sp. wkB178 TaxID=3120259 RepID=UPI0011467B40|nr:hypothetical protein [Gilliamella apicola]